MSEVKSIQKYGKQTQIHMPETNNPATDATSASEMLPARAEPTSYLVIQVRMSSEVKMGVGEQVKFLVWSRILRLDCNACSFYYYNASFYLFFPEYCQYVFDRTFGK